MLRVSENWPELQLILLPPMTLLIACFLFRWIARGFRAKQPGFVDGAWPSLDPTDYQPCWAIDALCEHLQAVAYGQIKRLLVNFPPAVRQDAGDMCFPAWTWARSGQS
jgi:hypothetical protein